MAATPLINGVNYSWADLTIVVFGVPIIGITKIEYKAKQESENNYGYGQEPTSVGFGKRTYEGMLEMYVDEWKKIIAASPGKNPFNAGFFDINVLFGSSRTAFQKDIVQACSFLENNMGSSQGDMKILVQIPLRVGGIKYQQ